MITGKAQKHLASSSKISKKSGELKLILLCN